VHRNQPPSETVNIREGFSLRRQGTQRMHVSPDLIQQIADQLQKTVVDRVRSSELAVEVSRLNEAVLSAIDSLTCDIEPASYRALLDRHSR
jgi:hypothetical protein